MACASAVAQDISACPYPNSPPATHTRARADLEIRVGDRNSNFREIASWASYFLSAYFQLLNENDYQLPHGVLFIMYEKCVIKRRP